MIHPFQNPPAETATILLIILFGITAFVMWKLNEIDEPLSKHDISSNGIVSLDNLPALNRLVKATTDYVLTIKTVDYDDYCSTVVFKCLEAFSG